MEFMEQITKSPDLSIKTTEIIETMPHEPETMGEIKDLGSIDLLDISRDLSPNPPSVFTRFIEEHPPPPKPKPETPTRIQYTKVNIENRQPEMVKRDSPKRTMVKLEEERAYEPKEIPDLSFSFVHRPKRKPRDQTPIREEHKSTQKEKQMFYDPTETVSTKLRNQRIRQKLALNRERSRIEEEEERERENRRKLTGKRIEPELRRLAAISEERQESAFKVAARVNNEASVRELKERMKKVEEEEVILRRNDRKLIMADVDNKRRKEQKENEKRVESERMDRARCEHERVVKYLNP